jgi:hypothetical protein
VNGRRLVFDQELSGCDHYRVRRFFNAVVGVPPERDAPKGAKLLWVRPMYYGWSLPCLAFLALLGVFTGMRGLWVLLGVGVCLWLFGFAFVNLQIRNDRRSSPPK